MVKERLEVTDKHIQSDASESISGGWKYTITISDQIFLVHIYDKMRYQVFVDPADSRRLPQAMILVDVLCAECDCEILYFFNHERNDYWAVKESEGVLEFVIPLENIIKSWNEVVTYVCPCCRYRTLHSRGHFEMCPVCAWEDDGQDDHDAEVVRGGPNKSLSLHQAQDNYRRYGAIDTECMRIVRPPMNDELTG